jgi:hypothetical protein
MKSLLGLTLGLALLGGFVAPGAREFYPYDPPASGGAGPRFGELAYDDGSFEGWGTAPGWAAEQQVGFTMPTGGPWLLGAVRLWMSGSLPHALVLRDASGSVLVAPGEVIDESITFTPGYGGPPDRWIEVEVSSLGLVLLDGEAVFAGTRLDGLDDGLGLDCGSAGGHSWAWYAGGWQDDGDAWGTDAAVHLRIIQTVFPAELTTWGAIKTLMR